MAPTLDGLRVVLFLSKFGFFAHLSPIKAKVYRNYWTIFMNFAILLKKLSTTTLWLKLMYIYLYTFFPYLFC